MTEDHHSATQHTTPAAATAAQRGTGRLRASETRFATETIVNGERKIVALRAPRSYTQAKTALDRLTLHLSIGQPY